MRKQSAIVVATAIGVAVAGCGSTKSSSGAIDVAATSCASGWSAPPAGQHDFTIDNTDSQALMIRLVSADHDGIYAQLTSIAPHQTQSLNAVLTAGSYEWQCFSFGHHESTSSTQTVAGSTTLKPDVIYPLTSDESEAAVLIYQEEVTKRLPALLRAVTQLEHAVTSGDRSLAKQRWLAAHALYDGLGGAYSAFGKYDAEIDGSSHGLQNGIHSRDFTGFFKIEQLLWQGTSMHAVLPYSDRLRHNVAQLQRAFPTLKVAAADLPVRAHEILEDALRDVLSDQTDYGSHSQLATVAANVRGTELVVQAVSEALNSRDPQLLRASHRVLAELTNTLDRLRLNNGEWPPLDSLSGTARMRVDAAVDRAVATLSEYPGVLQLSKDGD